eukprot:TRINITY_DN8828_c0_g1_i1.p1 TRINITY_DN8828_c0_g1~~TRINITY_DN8828_c0_g1_i1.p1  ORF type:complete len:627 (+),score=172.34 TRINITY_DN8828_c0_g1_i1:64-1944(+)
MSAAAWLLLPMAAASCRLEYPQGVVQGREGAGAACEYLGVPFAKPPVGLRRFVPPVPFGRWGGVRDATASGASCMQPGDVPSEGVNRSEDCLTLSVYQPGGLNGSVPVTVYLDGFAGQHRRLREVAVVPNARAGMLGFAAIDPPPHGPPGHAPPIANSGSRDQRLALSWVRRHIAHFGGDANRVTVIGGSSVLFHLASPPSWGLFSGAVAQSASATQTLSLEEALVNTRYVAAALAHGGSAGCEPAAADEWRSFEGFELTGPALSGAPTARDAASGCKPEAVCGGYTIFEDGRGTLHGSLHGLRPRKGANVTVRWGGQSDVMGCLRQADAAELVGFDPRSLPHPDSLFKRAWSPTVDGMELRAPLPELLESGALAPGVPLLAGSNLDEDVTPPVQLPCNASYSDFAGWMAGVFGADAAEELTPLYTLHRGELPQCGGEGDGRWRTAALRAVADATVLCPTRDALAAGFRGFRYLSETGRMTAARACYWQSFIDSGDPNGDCAKQLNLPEWKPVTEKDVPPDGLSPSMLLTDGRPVPIAALKAQVCSLLHRRPPRRVSAAPDTPAPPPAESHAESGDQRVRMAGVAALSLVAGAVAVLAVVEWRGGRRPGRQPIPTAEGPCQSGADI